MALCSLMLNCLLGLSYTECWKSYCSLKGNASNWELCNRVLRRSWENLEALTWYALVLALIQFTDCCLWKSFLVVFKWFSDSCPVNGCKFGLLMGEVQFWVFINFHLCHTLHISTYIFFKYSLHIHQKSCGIMYMSKFGTLQ